MNPSVGNTLIVHSTQLPDDCAGIVTRATVYRDGARLSATLFPEGQQPVYVSNIPVFDTQADGEASAQAEYAYWPAEG